MTWLKVLGAPPSGAREMDLDVLRGVAILLAMGWHFNGAPLGVPVVDQLLWPGRAIGWAGVDLFFVLSGFLVGRLLLVEHQNRGGVRVGRFLIRRAFKLWPVLYVFLLAQLVVGEKGWEEFLFQHLFHVQNYFQTPIRQTWSLAVEEHFYLGFAVLFAVTASGGLKPKLIVATCLGLMITAPLLRVAGVLSGADYVQLMWGTQYRIDGLACGVLLATTSVYYPRVVEALGRYRLALAALTVTGVATIASLSIKEAAHLTALLTISYLTGACFFLAVYKSAPLARYAAVFRPLAFIGLFSYGMYIWHPSMISIAPKLAARLPFGDGQGVLLAIEYLGAMALGIGATRVIEWPMLALRERLFPARPRPAPFAAGEAVT